MTFKPTLGKIFRSKLSEDIYAMKYRHEGAETWERLSETLVNDVCQGIPKDVFPDSDRKQLIQFMADGKFMAGGRYLYYAGRPSKFFNNCLRAGTKVLTGTGWRNVEKLGHHTVLSPVDGQIHPAEFVSHGTQPVYKYTFKPLRGRSLVNYEVYATRNHKWALQGGGYSEELQVGHVIPANNKSLSDYGSLAWVHGFMFGDGNSKGQLRLCGDKIKHLEALSTHGSVTYPESNDGDPALYFNQPVFWKELPTTSDPCYIASFIRGWLAADGPDGRILSSTRKEHLEWFREYAAYAGVTITGNLRSQIRDIRLGKYEYLDHEIFIQNFQDGQDWSGYKLVDVTYVADEEVFCPFEPVYNQIVIDHNIHTYQCYLLKAEEDTREDWADLSKRVESCLSTGGGIGVDYSVYRPSGSLLARTGGTASGPIPKMQMINEIGRGVMQGGSRRSAIYASLNWRHGDIQGFLKAKDWHSMKVPGTDKTLWDVKNADFNFPAPLDMTNISVNYDTQWILNYFRDGQLGDVFVQNVRQALETGEPGFSFNFFDKENETLRNACTEVTSADDSDVCNLGSVNLSRITDIRELAAVVELGTKFLLFGTLRAELPYQRVYDVREKNRRLGLGLMGVHEWLVQQSEKYTVTPELHKWLAVYKGVSDDVSRRTSEQLGISRPVANRAIAPTGTIGMLAGTTTGIEPVYAVAYKRRYLVNGKTWKYQYAVDHAAQEMIELYGTDPGEIESAIDLAGDYERRIRFQADVQDYVDMSISSTINLPPWGSKLNNPDTVKPFAETLAKYASRLRGFTAYPDGSRGGQPLTSVPYNEVKDKLGDEFEEHIEGNDVCDITGKGGSCGV